MLETIPWKIAKEVTKRVKVPTIGIGAGPYCDGQILVSQDMMGFFESNYFKFLKKYASVYDTMIKATKEYIDDVKNIVYPTTNHSYDIPEKEHEFFMQKLEIKEGIDAEVHEEFKTIADKRKAEQTF